MSKIQWLGSLIDKFYTDIIDKTQILHNMCFTKFLLKLSINIIYSNRYYC